MICSRCGLDKSLDEFYRDISKKSGLMSICRVCSAEKCHKYWKSERGKMAAIRYYRKKRRLYKKIEYAHNAVKRKITRVGVCSRCGSSSETTERHHPDYDTPLVVVELCRDCHRAIHAFASIFTNSADANSSTRIHR